MTLRPPPDPGRLAAPARAVGAIVLLAVVAGGCAARLDTEYGTIRGRSINGVSTLVQLLRDTGRATTALRRLPASIDPDVGAVVVVDDSFTGLRPEAHDVLERWLDAGPSRVLLLALRDDDASILYHRTVAGRDDLPAADAREARALLADAELALADATRHARTATAPFPDGLEPCERGRSEDGIAVRIDDAAEPIVARWELHRRLDGGSDADRLWETDGEPLLVHVRAGDDDILVLASAAPLLNGSLVDPGNRRLAERLVTLLPDGERVLLAGSAAVSAERDDAGVAGNEGDRAAWRLLGIQPLPWVAVQAALAMAAFCWYTAPIFGRPRRVRQDHAQDFGHHVAALASLVARSPAGAAFSLDRIDRWRRGGREPVTVIVPPSRGPQPSAPSPTSPATRGRRS